MPVNTKKNNIIFLIHDHHILEYYQRKMILVYIEVISVFVLHVKFLNKYFRNRWKFKFIWETLNIIALFLFSQEWLEKKNAYIHEKHRIKRIESENLRIQNEQVFWNKEVKIFWIFKLVKYLWIFNISKSSIF